MLDLVIFKQAFSLIAPLLGNQLKKKLEGTSSVVSFLRACGFDSLKDSFGSIYAHAIMEYGVQGIEAETEKERNLKVDERLLWVDYFCISEVRKIVESDKSNSFALDTNLEAHFIQGGDKTRLELKSLGKQFHHCRAELNSILEFYKKYQTLALGQNQSYALMQETNLETQKLILDLQKEILEIKNQNRTLEIPYDTENMTSKLDGLETFVREVLEENKQEQKELRTSIQDFLVALKKTSEEDSTLKQHVDKIYNIQQIVTAYFNAQTQTVKVNTIESAQLNADTQTNTFQNVNTVNIIDTTRKIPRTIGSPFQSDVFLGREKDIEEIHNRLWQDKSLLLLMNGEGGIGKTTLASKYYLEYERQYNHLIWIYADNGIKSALYSLIPSLGLKWETNVSEEQKWQELLLALHNLPKPSLLILDNANQAEDLERNYTTLKTLDNLHILLTTRAGKMGDAPVFKIIPLDEGTCIDLFNKHYPQFDVSETGLLKEILKAVGYNTLVVEVLSKNLRQFNSKRNQYSLATLLSDLQSHGLLHIQARDIQTAYHNESYLPSTPEKILSAMYDLSELPEEEIRLLSQFSILPAENLPYALLEGLMQPEDVDTWDKTLDSLTFKGWIEFTESTKVYKISPVIQAVVREKNQSRLYADCERMEGKLNNLLSKDQYTNIITKFQWIPYGKRFISFFPIIINETISKLYNNLATVLKDLGGETNLLEAKDLLKKAYSIFKVQFNENHPNTRIIKRNLDSINESLSKLQQP